MEIRLIKKGVPPASAVLLGELKSGDMFLHKGDCYLKVSRFYELVGEDSLYVNLVKNRIDHLDWREWVVPIKGYVEAE